MPIEQATVKPRTNEEQERLEKIYNKWQIAEEVRNQPYPQFNDRNAINYWNDSEKRFNGYVTPREEDEEDWQARVFDNITRNKVITILSRVTSQRVQAEILVWKRTLPKNVQLSQILQDAYDFSQDIENADKKFMHSGLVTLTQGTVHVYEGFARHVRKVKELEEYDPITGKTKFKEKEIVDWNGCIQQVVPNTEIFPLNPFEPDIQKQPAMFWVTDVPYETFYSDFGKYKNAKYVKSSKDLYVETDNGTKYDELKWIPSKYYSEQMVRIVRYFNRSEDDFQIIANGILLTEKDSPFPWIHKKYPFAKTIYEPFDAQFYWGKSMPDKFMGQQDVVNTLYNMMLDQSYLSIHPPILSEGITEIEDSIMVPGRWYPVDEIDKTRELQISGPSSEHYNMLEMTRRSMDLASVDVTQQGIPGGKGTTATEAVIAKEAALELLGLFIRFMEWLVKDQAELRLSNIIQFYPPKNIEKLTDEEISVLYEPLRVEDVQLADGTRGTRYVIFNENLPSAQDLDALEREYYMQGENVEFKFLRPQAIRDLRYTIKIVPASSIKTTKSLLKALDLELINTLMANPMFAQKVDWDEMLDMVFRDYDKSPTQLRAKQATPQAPEMPLSRGARGLKETPAGSQINQVAGAPRSPGVEFLRQAA